MFLLLLGGVETSSSKIIGSIGGDGTAFWQTSILWVAIGLAIGAFALTNKISAGGFSFQASREAVMAGFAGTIFLFFMSDLFSIVSKVGETTCPVGAGVQPDQRVFVWRSGALTQKIGDDSDTTTGGHPMGSQTSSLVEL